MIRIAVTAAAFDAITLPLGSVGFERDLTTRGDVWSGSNAFGSTNSTPCAAQRKATATSSSVWRRARVVRNRRAALEPGLARSALNLRDGARHPRPNPCYA
jgi:hypothetical protein